MGRTWTRQINGVRHSDTYDDTLIAGSTLESSATDAEWDFNALRSQVARIIGVTNWYDALHDRSLDGCDDDIDALEDKVILFPTNILTDVSVTAAQNWEVLSVAGSETPTVTAAVGAVTTAGAVVAYIAGFGAHSLTEVAGSDAINPKNLCIVRDSTTKEPIISSNGKEIYALIQCESITDGHTFDDVDHRVQLSFVEENSAGTDLVATAVADIAGKTINYSYIQRLAWKNIPEQAFVQRVFVDQSAATDITRAQGYTNQGTTPVDLTTAATLDLEGAGLVWSIRDDLEAILFSITEGSAGGTSTVTVAAGVDVFDINAVLNDFNAAIKVATGGNEIDIGVNTGTIETTSTNDLTVKGAGELLIDDGNRAASTYSTAIKFSDASAEWDNFETAYGEVSILNAIVQAGSIGTARAKTIGVLTADVTANTNVTGAGGSPNLDAQLGNYSGVTFVSAVDNFLNGTLLRNGADAAANNDVYPGTTPANGDLKFEFDVKIDDVLTMVIWS